MLSQKLTNQMIYAMYTLLYNEQRDTRRHKEWKDVERWRGWGPETNCRSNSIYRYSIPIHVGGKEGRYVHLASPQVNFHPIVDHSFSCRPFEIVNNSLVGRPIGHLLYLTSSVNGENFPDNQLEPLL